MQWEFIEGPDLLECLNRKGGPLAEGEAAFYFCQLLRGLLFMHQTGFAHRDLKPENCVLQESTKVVKVGGWYGAVRVLHLLAVDAPCRSPW